jgi:hypothetical protein
MADSCQREVKMISQAISGEDVGPVAGEYAVPSITQAEDGGRFLNRTETETKTETFNLNFQVSTFNFQLFS